MLRSNHEELFRLRTEKGHSLRTLAAEAGISHQAIGRLESGPVVVYPATAKRLADALGVEMLAIAVVVQAETTEVAS